MVHEVVVFLVYVVHNGIFPKAGKRGVKVPVDGRFGTLQPFTLLVPLQTVGSDVKFFRRPLWPVFDVEVADDHLGEGVILLIEHLHLHIEGFNLFVILVECWRDEHSQGWHGVTSLRSQTSDSGCQRLQRIDVHGQMRDDEDSNDAYSPAVACSEEQFFSGVVGGM
ncbi:unnamed protein product [Heligmosomoides polygyrus]|uniref:Secreted protein n=1 Tax=Heligmosomoides polygyrus TaxID=6339 RepID=A0A183FE11_HELPZ|nr:unnamed protein product [Heligmosomoides polygyrus]